MTMWVAGHHPHSLKPSAFHMGYYGLLHPEAPNWQYHKANACFIMGGGYFVDQTILWFFYISVPVVFP